MSLNNEKSVFSNPGLIGASLAVIVSVPLTAYIGSLFGDTYSMRVAIYGGFLLWVIVGAISIVFVTTGSKKILNLKSLLLWFISTWLWPIPILMWLKQKNKSKK